MTQHKPEKCARIEELEAERDWYRAALEKIHDLAHVESTGPTVPDAYWTIRYVAERALEGKGDE